MPKDIALPYNGRCFLYTHEGKNEVWISVGSSIAGHQVVPENVPQLSPEFCRHEWKDIREMLLQANSNKAMTECAANCAAYSAGIPCLCCTPICWMAAKTAAYQQTITKELADFVTEKGMPTEAVRLDMGKNLKNPLKRDVSWAEAVYDSEGKPCVSATAVTAIGMNVVSPLGVPIWPPYGHNIVVDLALLPTARNGEFVQPPAQTAPQPMVMSPPAPPGPVTEEYQRL